MPAKFGPDKVVLPAGTSDPAGTREAGELFFNTTDGVFKYHNGTNWDKVSAVIPIISSISGAIYETVGGNITITGTGFLSGDCSVEFSGSFTTTLVNATASSDTSLVVAVPSAAYASVGTVIVKVTNNDNSQSPGSSFSVLALPTGGTITTSGSYRIHTFTSSDIFTNTISTTAEYLIVAGGGGGGSDAGGGGGAGGMITGSTSITPQSYTVTVGGGGAGGTGATSPSFPSDDAANGGNSSALGITSLGGGKGGMGQSRDTGRAGAGGSGGGGGGTYPSANNGGDSGLGTAGQGNNGYHVRSNSVIGQPETGAGGGGKGAASNSQDGGAGASSSISGSPVTYAGGGGGGGWTNSAYRDGYGGSGGGGDGGGIGSSGNKQQRVGFPGTANTGGGGGGGNQANGGNGGSGIVIIRYQI